MNEFDRCHVPAFGSWNNSDDYQFSDYFEMEKKIDLYPYNYYVDRDLYVAGDVYGHDVVNPAVIVVRRRRTKNRNPRVDEPKKGHAKGSPIPDSSLSPLSSPPVKKRYKPVVEDLYKISPELLYAKPKGKKKGWGLFSSCLMPICAA